MSLRRRYPSHTVLALAIGCVLLPIAATAATQPAASAATAAGSNSTSGAAASSDFSPDTVRKHKVV
ncbi:MAG: hypothetical protein KGK04_04775, partial [Xanthomonadaceae bacterium]|nr:hypothetical protein [Xanthomonadaceae bacterium]